MRRMSVLTVLRKCLFSNQGFSYFRTFTSEPASINRIIRNPATVNVAQKHTCWCSSRNQSQKLQNFSRRYLPLEVDTRFKIYGGPSCSINYFHTGSRLRVSRLPRRNKQTDSSANGKEEVKEGKTVGAKETGVKNGAANGETLVQKFKRVYKEHGYVLIAVHLVTSAVWFGSFFAVIQCGVDIVAILEQLGFSEKILKPFKSSSAGNAALAYLMYKLATPARYTVTLTGTALGVRLLRRLGWIKPDKITHVTRQAGRYGRLQLRKQRIKTKKAIANTRGVISFRKMRDRARHVTKQARDYGKLQLGKQRIKTKKAIANTRGVISFKKMRERAKNESQNFKEKIKRKSKNKSDEP